MRSYSSRASSESATDGGYGPIGPVPPAWAMRAGYARSRACASVGCPPMAVLLGVLVAISFGSADFAGGRASRTAPTLTVLFVGQVVAVVGALVIALVVGADVEGSDLAYGAAAGACNVVGLGLLYQGLAS